MTSIIVPSQNRFERFRGNDKAQQPASSNGVTPLVCSVSTKNVDSTLISLTSPNLGLTTNGLSGLPMPLQFPGIKSDSSCASLPDPLALPIPILQSTSLQQNPQPSQFRSLSTDTSIALPPTPAKAQFGPKTPSTFGLVAATTQPPNASSVSSMTSHAQTNQQNLQSSIPLSSNSFSSTSKQTPKPQFSPLPLPSVLTSQFSVPTSTSSVLSTSGVKLRLGPPSPPPPPPPPPSTLTALPATLPTTLPSFPSLSLPVTQNGTFPKSLVSDQVNVTNSKLNQALNGPRTRSATQQLRQRQQQKMLLNGSFSSLSAAGTSAAFKSEFPPRTRSHDGSAKPGSLFQNKFDTLYHNSALDPWRATNPVRPKPPKIRVMRKPHPNLPFRSMDMGSSNGLSRRMAPRTRRQRLTVNTPTSPGSPSAEFISSGYQMSCTFKPSEWKNDRDIDVPEYRKVIGRSYTATRQDELQDDDDMSDKAYYIRHYQAEIRETKYYQAVFQRRQRTAQRGRHTGLSGQEQSPYGSCSLSTQYVAPPSKLPSYLDCPLKFNYPTTVDSNTGWKRPNYLIKTFHPSITTSDDEEDEHLRKLRSNLTYKPPPAARNDYYPSFSAQHSSSHKTHKLLRYKHKSRHKKPKCSPQRTNSRVSYKRQASNLESGPVKKKIKKQKIAKLYIRRIDLNVDKSLNDSASQGIT